MPDADNPFIDGMTLHYSTTYNVCTTILFILVALTTACDGTVFVNAPNKSLNQDMSHSDMKTEDASTSLPDMKGDDGNTQKDLGQIKDLGCLLYTSPSPRD